MRQEPQTSPVIKRNLLFRVPVFGIVLLACVLCSSLKSGFFIDEIYTYGFANSHSDLLMRKDGPLIDKTIAGQILFDYVSVSENERFDFASIYYNQAQDSHPPLHYWMINSVCSLFPETFTKWTGLGLNFVLFALTILLLHGLVLKFTDSETNAAMAVVLYGLSQIALSTFLMIRMYMLLTFLSVLLTYQIVSILKKPKWYTFIGVGLTLFAGLMSQYIFFFYAFFLCGACGIRMLVRKEYKSLVFLLACFLAGVAALYLAFPTCLDHLFADKFVSGSTALGNVLAISNYAYRFHAYGRDISHGIPIATLFGILLSCILVWNLKSTCECLKKDNWQDFLVVVLSSLATLFVVAMTSPVCAPRYVYHLIPVFVFIVVCLLNIAKQIGGIGKWMKPHFMIPVLGALTIAMTLAKPPDFLFLERKKIDSILEEYTEYPCIHVDISNSLFKGEPTVRILANIPQLMRFKDVFITNNSSSDKLKEYLGARDLPSKVVLFVENSRGDIDDYQRAASDVLANTGYTRYEFLDDFGSSKIYLLTKGN